MPSALRTYPGQITWFVAKGVVGDFVVRGNLEPAIGEGDFGCRQNDA